MNWHDVRTDDSPLNQLVLCYLENGEMVVLQRTTKYRWEPPFEYDPYQNPDSYPRVTHWTPLPDPP